MSKHRLVKRWVGLSLAALAAVWPLLRASARSTTRHERSSVGSEGDR